MTGDSIPIVRLTKKQMQELFQKHQLWDKIKSKELKCVVEKERHANPLKSGQVFCTYSQLVSYRNSKDDEVVRAHQYKKPDGTLGASGKSDPFRIDIGGVVYKLQKS
jgi:hypothetical protein